MSYIPTYLYEVNVQKIRDGILTLNLEHCHLIQFSFEGRQSWNELTYTMAVPTLCGKVQGTDFRNMSLFCQCHHCCCCSPSFCRRLVIAVVIMTMMIIIIMMILITTIMIMIIMNNNHY